MPAALPSICFVHNRCIQSFWNFFIPWTCQASLDTLKNTLETIARQKNTSMGEVVREAFSKYIAENHIDFAIENIKRTQGLWKDRSDIEDSDEWVSKLRMEWNNRLYFPEDEI